MTVAHYGRLERRRGPRPSPITLARIARGLRFTHVDRDRLFVAAGYDPARRSPGTTHVAPALMRVLDRMSDTPALVLDEVGVVLHQTRSAGALFGDASPHVGGARTGHCRVVHRSVGELALRRDTLSGDGVRVIVYTPAPGFEAALALITVLGHHRFDV